MLPNQAVLVVPAWPTGILRLEQLAGSEEETKQEGVEGREGGIWMWKRVFVWDVTGPGGGGLGLAERRDYPSGSYVGAYIGSGMRRYTYPETDSLARYCSSRKRGVTGG